MANTLLTPPSKPPFQFGLGSLFMLTAAVAVGLVAWNWMSWPVRGIVAAPFIVAALIAVIVFVQAAVFYLAIDLVGRVLRLFKKRQDRPGSNDPA